MRVRILAVATIALSSTLGCGPRPATHYSSMGAPGGPSPEEREADLAAREAARFQGQGDGAGVASPNTAYPAPGAAPSRCAEVGSHQGAIMSQNAPSMRDSFARSFTDQCLSEGWTAARQDCVLASQDARGIEACNGSEQASALATPQECAQAANHQAKVIAPKAPSMQGTLTSSLQASCVNEGWSRSRTQCVMQKHSARGLESCAAEASKPAQPTPPRQATRAECRAAGKNQGEVMSRDTKSMRATFIKTFTDECLGDKWSQSRATCVARGRSAQEFEACQ